MRSRFSLIKASTVGVLLVPAFAFAQGPVSQVGIKGSYNEYSYDSDISQIDDSKERLPTVGAFYNYGNKLTSQGGFIYQAGIEANYGEKDDNELRDARGEIDLGLRAPLDNNLYADFIVGGGYDWSRFEPDAGNGLETRTTNKSPFAKLGLGLTHQGQSMTTRFEAGTRYSLDAETKLRVENVGSETLDMKDKANPYAELTFLWNQREGALPVSASLYYERTNFELADADQLTANTKLQSDEVGLKLGMMF
ncbi:outer membrane beta-barrel protein [Halopseudomonas pelagia]|uniref:outer membrane beta-barrel protein n=1 Tax=Halopseudomonas pelagia TaxID=553151 RepID=UPI0030DB3579|tara:strand:- start:191086 stop:191838 length:753 start_codon:yes stop_codon:yes gene_type:complete